MQECFEAMIEDELEEQINEWEKAKWVVTTGKPLYWVESNKYRFPQNGRAEHGAFRTAKERV